MSLEEIESYLTTATLPKEVDLNPYERIVDLPKFIESHLGHCKSYEGKEIEKPYRDRLEQLVRILKNKEHTKGMYVTDESNTFKKDLDL